MNTLTVIVILIIVFGAVIGFMRGLLRCLIGIAFSLLSKGSWAVRTKPQEFCTRV